MEFDWNEKLSYQEQNEDDNDEFYTNGEIVSPKVAVVENQTNGDYVENPTKQLAEQQIDQNQIVHAVSLKYEK